MTAQTPVYGRLIQEPQPHKTKTGTAMTFEKIHGKCIWLASRNSYCAHIYKSQLRLR